jgi:flagellin-like protein
MEQDRAVSPVISTILMVAVAVILAATISVFVLDIGEDVEEPAPTVSQSSGTLVGGTGNDDQVVRVTHVAGDNVEVEEMEIVVAAPACTPNEARLTNFPVKSGSFDSENIEYGAALIDESGDGAAGVSYPRVNSWACQWDSRVSRSHTKAPRPRLSNPGLSQGLSTRESEGLDQRPLTPGLADGQPIPPTASGPVGRMSRFEPGSNQAYALPPTSKLVGFRAVTAVIEESTQNTFESGAFFEFRLNAGACNGGSGLQDGDTVTVKVVHTPSNAIIIDKTLRVTE